MNSINIGGRPVGAGHPVYIIAEMSANHNQDYDRAVEIIRAAADAGADAVKVQTYTPDTLTMKSEREYFKIKGTLWDGDTLYDLYQRAFMPWEWQPELQSLAEDLGLDFFSTVYDETSVNFLENMDVPVYKIASFELVDLPLLMKVAGTGKPIILSTGMATLSEIDEAVRTIQKNGGEHLALLKCTSAYPAPPEEMNLKTIPHLAETFHVPAGLSDHTLRSAVAVAAVALGASLIEKHFTLTRDDGGADSAFSMEPQEFKNMVESIRITEKALGTVNYHIRDSESNSRVFRRSMFVVKDVKEGEKFTSENVKSIRPCYGLHTRYWDEIRGKRSAIDINRGTPLTWELISN